MGSGKTSYTENHLESLKEALDSGTFVQVRHMLRSLPHAEVAHLLESSPPRDRQILWNLIDQQGEILQYLSEDIGAEFVRTMDTETLVSAMSDLEPDDIADLLQSLPKKVTEQVLQSMDQQNRERLEAVLVYPEDTAGGLMNTDTITIRPHITLDVVLRYLRLHTNLPEMTDNLYVVSRKGRFVGLLPLTKLVTLAPSVSVREAMQTDVKAIDANMPTDEVALLFERHDLVSAPVVDEQGKLLGRITIDDVVDVIREEADHSLMSMAGLGEDEDTFSPVLKASRRRAVWLGLNLITAFIGSMVIGLFEGTLEKVVALAILIPVVASMGGIAGSQTLTIVIRGMAQGQIGKANSVWLLSRELGVGLLNGLLWAAVAGAAASIWFSDPALGLIISAAMIINLVVAAFSGASLPLLLRQIGIDPALAGGVILTTITDVVGYLSFLGLATLAYG